MEESEKIKCPSCKSEQVSAQKKGFSGRKAVAGAVLTGGIGILAGTIGSNKMRVYCLKCGHDWDPAKEFSFSKKKKILADDKNKKAWNKKFKAYYEEGDLVLAQKMLRPNYPNPEEILPATHQRYKDIKANDRVAFAINLILVLIVVVCFVKCVGG